MLGSQRAVFAGFMPNLMKIQQFSTATLLLFLLSTGATARAHSDYRDHRGTREENLRSAVRSGDIAYGAPAAKQEESRPVVNLNDQVGTDARADLVQAQLNRVLIHHLGPTVVLWRQPLPSQAVADRSPPLSHIRS